MLISIALGLTSLSTNAELLADYLRKDTPLSGKIWDLRSESFVEPEALLDSLANGTWLLLGETHENLDHHRIQSRFIRYLDKQNRLGALALEMADDSQQIVLDSAHSGKTEISVQALNWNPGWPWEWYQEPVTEGIRRATRVLGADLTRDAKMSAYRNEQLEVPADSGYTEFMLDLLYESHCGQMPKSQLGNMLRVQYARDLSMLEAMRANTEANRVNLLLAGTVHTRYDLGIPYWNKTLESKTLLMIAANEDSTPQAYYPQSYSQEPVADYILFTPATEYESGCQ